jgi:hypothetical protein
VFDKATLIKSWGHTGTKVGNRVVLAKSAVFLLKPPLWGGKTAILP